MTRRGYRILLVTLGLAMVVSAGITGAVGATETTPSITVTIDGSVIHEGDRYATDTDPTLTISASVSPNRTIRTVTVQVNGYADSSYSPNSSEFSTSTTPDFDHGNNSVRVLVEDAHGNITSFSFTVKTDSRAPTVYLTSPFYSDGWIRGNTTVNGSATTVAGVIEDISEISRATLSYEHAATDHSGSMDVAGGSERFSRELLLGEGKNTVKLTVFDRFDNGAIFNYRITVNDSLAPTINLSSTVPNETRKDTIALDGTVNDTLWVHNATVKRSMNGSTETWTVIPDEDYSVSDDRLSVDFEQDVTLLNGTNTITITAEDSTGHTTTENFTVDYTPSDDTEEDRPISIEVTHQWTKFVDERTLQLVGTANGTDIGQLTVETFTADGETVDYVIVHQGSQTDDLEFETTVRTAPGKTRLLIRAFDPKRNGDTATVWVDPAQGDTVFADRGAVFDTPTPSPTPTPTPRTIVQNTTKTPPTPTPQVETRVVTEVKEVNVTNSSAKKGGGGILGQVGRFAGGVFGKVKGWIDGAIGFVQSLNPLLAVP